MRAAIRWSFVDPLSAGLPRWCLGPSTLFQRQQLANSLHRLTATKTLRFSPRLGFALREDLSLQLRYSIYSQELQLPSTLANCTTIRKQRSACLQIRRRPWDQWKRCQCPQRHSARWTLPASACGATAMAKLSAAGPQGAAERQDSDLFGWLLAELQHARRATRTPTMVCWSTGSRTSPGPRRRREVQSSRGSTRSYYTPPGRRRFGRLDPRARAGHAQPVRSTPNCGCSINFQMGRNPRSAGFAPNGIGSARLSTPSEPATRSAAPSTGGVSAENADECRSGSCRRKSDLKGSVYADAGGPVPTTRGPTTWAQTGAGIDDAR